MNNKQSNISKEYSKAINHKNSIVSSTGGARFANYSTHELETLPKAVAESSFGCGNPLALSSVKKGDTVLDLGCGAGLDLLLAAEKVGTTGKVIGVDMNDDMLAKAKQAIELSPYNIIDLQKGMIEDLPIESSSIDVVISNCVINLSSNKEQAFAEISRVLKPNGEMLISDIVSENLPWWIKHSGIMQAACAGAATSESHYLHNLEKVGMIDCKVIERQHYTASQLAFIVVDTLPKFLTKISCCGKSLIKCLFTTLAKPVANNLWSAKFSAKRQA